ncbi:S8 family peptidase, partial [Amycolatopsis marina]
MRRTSRAVGVLALFSAALATGIGTSATVATAAEGAVVQAERHVPGGYVVSLKDGVQASSSPAAIERAAASLAQKYDAALKSTFTASMRGFAVRGMSEAAASRLAAEPSVRAVFEDGTAQIADTQTGATYGIDRVDQRNLPLDKEYTYNNTADDVTAYIIDTGIRYSHNDFEGRAKSGYDHVDEDPDANDCNGHGTHVAGTVGGKTWGLAKKVDLVGVKVLGCGGSAPDSDSIEGIEWVTKNAALPAVANMSLTFDTPNIGDEAMAGMVRAGVPTAVAAGNSSADACNTGPAKLPEVITVGSTDASDNRSSFSNYGSCVDIFAPGSNITSASNSSDSGSTNMSGTSMASPHVAGAVALYLQANQSATPAQVGQTLNSNATTSVVKNPGSGSPNRLLYTGFIGGEDPGDPPGEGEFSLSVVPGSVEVVPGGYVSATVSTTAGEAGAEDIALTASGLPSGAEAVLQPATVTAGKTAKLTLKTSSSTPAGTSTVTVTGT